MSKVFRTNEELIEGYLYGWEDRGKTPNGNLYFVDDVLYSYGTHFPLAVRVGSLYVVNADKYSVTTSSKHQAPLFRLISNQHRLEIPFSALVSMSGGSFGWYGEVVQVVRDLDIVDWEEDRYVDTGRLDKYGEKIFDHVMGGSVFKWSNEFFVCGMDRSGVGERGRFFLTQLDELQLQKYGEPTTYAEAIELLKPIEIRKAEKIGKEVHRQGEWFFVEALGKTPNFPEKTYDLIHRDAFRESMHFATEGIRYQETDKTRQLVRGVVKHKGKEHKQLKLFDAGTPVKDRKWFEVYESIQGPSWSADGYVD